MTDRDITTAAIAWLDAFGAGRPCDASAMKTVEEQTKFWAAIEDWSMGRAVRRFVWDGGEPKEVLLAASRAEVAAALSIRRDERHPLAQTPAVASHATMH